MLFRHAEDDNRLAALSLLDGQIVWEKEIPPECLLAVTPDRTTQAYWQDGEVRIGHWPDEAYVTVELFDINPLDLDFKTYSNREVYNRTSDTAFTPDGRYLLTLPTLDRVPNQQEKGTRVLARGSNTLTVIDTATGKVPSSLSRSSTSEFSNGIKASGPKLLWLIRLTISGCSSSSPDHRYKANSGVASKAPATMKYAL